MPRRPLSWWTLLGGGCAAVLLVVITAQVLVGGQPLDPAELDRRCRQAVPAWPNYDEDIKAQIGVRPFAEWEGEPVSATRDDDGIAVAFVISGPWAGRDAAMPVLIRDALGAVHRNEDWHRDGPHVVYRFPAGNDSAALALDSIEVRYPRHTRRLLVREDAES